MSEAVLERAEGRVSYHDSVEEMLKRIREDDVCLMYLTDGFFKRKFDANFCLQGLSCQLCSNGPCRINEKGGYTKFAACLQYQWEQLPIATTPMKHLEHLGLRQEGKTPFKITDVDKLRWMCSKVGINTNQDINQMAKDLRRCTRNPDEDWG